MPDPATATALVYLRQPLPALLDQVAAGWSAVWPNEPAPELLGRDRVIAWQATDTSGALTLMPVPVPGSEAPEQPATSWLWPQAQEALRTHTAHVVIAAGGPDPLTTLQALTRISAVVAAVTGALGVQVQSDGPLVAAEPFVGLAQAEPLPVLLWVQLACWVQDGRAALATAGLKQFGGMEVEIPSASRSCGELRLWAAQLAVYLIEKRSPLGDGDTVGLNADERIQVTYARSEMRPGEMVYQLSGL